MTEPTKHPQDRSEQDQRELARHKKSIGHIFFHNGYEYFHCGGNNSIYRAPIENPMEKTAYGNIRTGARFESTYRAWENSPLYKQIVKDREMVLCKELESLKRFRDGRSDAPAPVCQYERGD